MFFNTFVILWTAVNDNVECIITLLNVVVSRTDSTYHLDKSMNSRSPGDFASHNLSKEFLLEEFVQIAPSNHQFIIVSYVVLQLGGRHTVLLTSNNVEVIEICC